ncbi:MAG: class I SAM-dependent methyltransferase [Clostridiales bacterium]|nr:class I SAM-dependent methyltransferase [Clostridiales bacterium]
MTEKIGKITLDYKYYPGEDLYCDGKVEDELLSIVKEHPASEYGRIIEERADWPTLYHLSALRGNIVEWIPVEKGMKVLEVGSGCGAITGTLAEKAGEVTCIDLSKKRSMINAYRHKECDNVTIHVGNFQDIEPELPCDYDYIFLIGVFEYGQGYIGTDKPYERFMTILKKHLKPDGRMVIAIENKFGLKYWAGCKEDHLGRYFAGLEDYPEGGGVRTFTRKGLEKICAAAGISEYSFYYPYPDYKFMSSVYSDAYLPKVGELSANRRNFDRDRLFLFDEKNVFDTIIREEEFPLYSNSYMLVIGRELEIKYAKYSNDRAEQFAIRTDIYEKQDGARFVKKVPLYQSAQKHVEGILEAAEKLNKKYEGGRFRINRCEKAADGVFLEYLSGHTLEELLDERLGCADEAGFLALVEEYAQAVSYREEIPVADYDLIFGNILVEGDRWTIIDYEWTFDRVSTGKDMVLRALYCYLIGSEKRRKASLSYLKDRYGYSEQDLEKFAEEEIKFQKYVTGNRLSMTELRNEIGYAVLPATHIAERQAAQWNRKRVQIYEDTGSGFSEEQSFFLPDAYEGRDVYGAGNKIAFDINIAEDVRAIRIDPAMENCMVTVEELLLYESDTVEKQISMGECLLNGKLISDNVVIFATEDPNMTIDFMRLKCAGKAYKLSVRLEIVPLSQKMAGEAVRGFSKKGLFGRR